MIKKLLHTRYRVTDLEKTVSFYRDVLGLEEVRRHTSGRGSQLVFLKAPGSDEEIELCKFDESGPVVVGPDLTHLAFEVDNIEEFAKQTRFGRRIAHGMLSASLISAVIASELPGQGGIYLGQTFQFVAPVFPGDTVTARVTVSAVREDKPILKLETVCTNQRDEVVIKGEATILVS